MSVLVLQHNGAARDHLISSLESLGFCPSVAAATEVAPQVAAGSSVAAVIVDLTTDVFLTTCKQVRAVDKTIPLVVLFDDESAAQLEAALKAGATHCVLKPVNPLELGAKLRSAIGKYRPPGELEAEDSSLPDSDPLTKLGNQRDFRTNLNRAWRRDWRSRWPLSLIVINIDDFAEFNRLYGRSAGDDCLQRIATTLQGSLYRPDDLVTYSGGGEFAVLSPSTDRAGAAVVADRLRSKVLELAIPHAGGSSSQQVTVSLGAATAASGSEMAIDDLVAGAERALSQAKLRGRNQWVVQQEEAPSWLA
jgi:diguanylate cyclase (GGDEF)-like protein